MSIITQIKCDQVMDEFGGTCRAAVFTSAPSGTAAALEAAERQGWWVRAGRQICPAHRRQQ